MDILQVQIKSAGYADNKKAIENIGFPLQEGELIGLIGLNGAGKSTTINISYSPVFSLAPYDLLPAFCQAVPEKSGLVVHRARF